MKIRHWSSVLSIMGCGLCSQACGAEAQLIVNLPSVQGARVKRPYVAVWIEKAATHDFVGNIAVWYDTDKPNNRGAKWLPDLRTWWRAIGSQAVLPIDGVSGATRPAGDQAINLGSSLAFQKLPAGNYDVVVEATREHGGYDLVRLGLQWPPRSVNKAEASGSQELGPVKLTVKP
jgi:hypothetical protein